MHRSRRLHRFLADCNSSLGAALHGINRDWAATSTGFERCHFETLLLVLFPSISMSGNAGRQRPAIGTFDDGFEGLGPSRELPNARAI